MLKDLLFLAGMKIYERETDPVRVAERKEQEDALRRFEEGIHYQKLQLDDLEEVPKRTLFQKKPKTKKNKTKGNSIINNSNITDISDINLLNKSKQE